MAYDPTITLGNILTVAIIFIGGAGALIRHSFTAGKYTEDFRNLHEDLTDIKKTLKEQDVAFREKAASDAIANGINLVLQQRVVTLETELLRIRESLHDARNEIQKIFAMQERA